MTWIVFVKPVAQHYRPVTHHYRPMAQCYTPVTRRYRANINTLRYQYQYLRYRDYIPHPSHSIAQSLGTYLSKKRATVHGPYFSIFYALHYVAIHRITCFGVCYRGKIINGQLNCSWAVPDGVNKNKGGCCSLAHEEHEPLILCRRKHPSHSWFFIAAQPGW